MAHAHCERLPTLSLQVAGIADRSVRLRLTINTAPHAVAHPPREPMTAPDHSAHCARHAEMARNAEVDRSPRPASHPFRPSSPNRYCLEDIELTDFVLNRDDIQVVSLPKRPAPRAPPAALRRPPLVTARISARIGASAGPRQKHFPYLLEAAALTLTWSTFQCASRFA